MGVVEVEDGQYFEFLLRVSPLACWLWESRASPPLLTTRKSKNSHTFIITGQ